jgi:hypothetical protein
MATFGKFKNMFDRFDIVESSPEKFIHINMSLTGRCIIRF